MLLATVVAILFIPMLYVVVERLFARRAVEPTAAPTDPAESAS
jgi:hypothetical protein